MFRFIFLIWLVSFYSSSGAPANTNVTGLSVSLGNLARTCGNSFLSTQINNRLKDCTAIDPHSKETHFQCMLFYDINNQLCTAVASKKLLINEDYSTKIAAAQDVRQLCLAAKNWTFIDIGEVYKRTVKEVFQDPIICARMCIANNDDILNTESNFYCKYFKWGTEMLKTSNSDTAVSLQSISLKTPVLPNSAVPGPVQLPASGIENEVKPKDVFETETKQQTLHTSTQVLKEQENAAKVAEVKSTSELASSPAVEANNSETALEQQPSIGTTSTEKKVVLIEKEGEDKAVIAVPGVKNEISGELPKFIEKQPKSDQKVDSIDDAENKNMKEDKSEPTVDEKKVNPAGDLLSQVELPKQSDIGEPDDYQNDLDSDEGRGLSDAQGGDDIDGPVLGDLDVKPDLDQNKITGKRIESPIGPYSNDVQKDFYPNTMNDGFAEEDDHFFPFFLTAIIMVVLLYVLYHNKSKVTKVIMGLIVEGRQSGRRRNSRGHAYRRLDTLEQAMSANTTAPPSKIIY